MNMALCRLLTLALLAGPGAAQAAEPASPGAVAPAGQVSMPTSSVAPGAAGSAAVTTAVTTAAAPAAAAAPIPFRRDSASGAGGLAGSAWGVLVVSLLAIGAVLYVRKRLNLNPTPRQGAAPRLLRVLETQRLGPRALLSVVEFGGQQHLIAQSEHGVSHLVTAPAASASDGAAGFGAPGAARQPAPGEQG